MKLRLDDRIRARELRTQGATFSEIINEIPGIAKGTLNGWLKDIELTKEQKDRIFSKIRDAGNKGRLRGAFTNREKRMKVTKQIVSGAKSEARDKLKDSLFIVGAMLYWAEGTKTREELCFTNSDHSMVELMMRWFRETCFVPENKFRIALNISTLHDKNESESFWSEITKVPLGQFYKTNVKPTPLKGKRNLSYMGTCSIRINDKNLFRKVLGWKLGILENI